MHENPSGGKHADLPRRAFLSETGAALLGLALMPGARRLSALRATAVAQTDRKVRIGVVGGSHTFLTHEFIDALIHGRNPAIDVHEAVAYTLPGVVAHQSALQGGKQMKIPVL